MSELLTKEEYVAIAKSITFPVEPFINGGYQKPDAGKTMETINPATGDVIANVYACDATDVDNTVTLARAAFDSGVWSAQSPGERKAVLLKLADLTEKNLNELAVLEASKAASRSANA